MRRTRTTALAVLALLNVFTLAAGLAVAHMLPPRLARLHVAVARRAPCGQCHTSADPGRGSRRAQAAALPTASGLAAMLGAALPSAETGPGVGIEVADAATGRVLYSDNADAPATPASTTKLVTAVAALAALGPDARFTTTVRQAGGTIVLVGGGDPTLAVNGYPSADYPRPATLAQLAAGTARALRAQGRRSVRLGYDTSLFSGPDLAPGWTEGDIATGRCHADRRARGRPGTADAGGALEDDDDPVNYRPRTYDPAGMTAAAFAAAARAVRHHGHRHARAGRRAGVRPGARQRELTAARRDRRADAARVQQRDRREPGPARGDRARHARHVQRRRGRRHDRVAAAWHHDADQPGRRQRPVAR